MKKKSLPKWTVRKPFDMFGKRREYNYLISPDGEITLSAEGVMGDEHTNLLRHISRLLNKERDEKCKGKS